MPTIKQLSVFLERGSGSLRAIVEILAEAQITITTMTIDGATEHNTVRLLLSDPEEGYRLLKSFGLNVCITTTTATVIDSSEIPQAEVLKAKIINEELHVSGLTPGRVWNVYNMYGELVSQNVAKSVKEKIPLKGREVYIVQSDNRTIRIIY